MLTKEILDRYKEEDLETKDLIKFCKNARKRGYLTKEEFIKICKWKSPRPIKHFMKNSEEIIKETTRKAFSTSYEKRKIEILDELKGVNIRMASAILTIIYPEMYGVLDFRAWNTLENVGEVKKRKISYNVKDWYRYLMIIRGLAKKFNVTPRRIDYVLWSYDKELSK
jgi:thermostable 8-oxoguanine DNA glycosylase